MQPVQVDDIPRVARAIYRRMPNVWRFMDRDDIRQECELQRLRGEARSFHQLHCHVIGIARHFGGRDGERLQVDLTPNLQSRERLNLDSWILIGELIGKLTSRQREIVDHQLEGMDSVESARVLGLHPHTVWDHRVAAVKRMRAAVGR